jgi:hypothetical protein
LLAPPGIAVLLHLYDEASLVFVISATPKPDQIVEVEDNEIGCKRYEGSNDCQRRKAEDRITDTPNRLFFSLACIFIQLPILYPLTIQKDKGRKKMLIDVSSLTFSPSRVAALLSITPLALNS